MASRASRCLAGFAALGGLCVVLGNSGCSADPGPGTGGTGGQGAAGTGNTGGIGGTGNTSGGAAGSAGQAGAAGNGNGSNCPAPPEPPACTATDILGRLRCIPGLNVTGTGPYNLEFEQPVDHKNPAGARFKQRMTLIHRSETLPLVLATTGYGLGRGEGELGRTFGLNVLQIEHRFFGPSAPAEPAWQHLTIEQAANDSHRIWQAFKWIYPAKWVNTGGSKGGETAVYHRRFFPCDVDATVAYVAPVVHGLDDPRFVQFLDSVGGAEFAECRQKLKDFQIAVATRRDEMLSRMTDAQYSKLGKEVAFEHSLIEFFFTFWQYADPSTCAKVPASDADAATLFNFFSTNGQLSLWNDNGYQSFQPYWYQVAAELGLPGTYDAHFRDLLKKRDTYGPYVYLPAGVRPDFDPQAMLSVQEWVKVNGQRLMFINGEYDPWSAGAYEPNLLGDSVLFSVPRANHSANIAALPTDDKERALSTIERWLGVKRVTPWVASESVETSVVPR